DPAVSASGDTTARAVDIAINSVRGRAVEALVQYAEWLVAVGLRPAGKAIADHQGGASLARRLDLALGNSLAVRSVFGLTLASVASLDPDWLATQLAAYFPSDPPEASQVVWEAFVSFNGPAEHLYRLLDTQYDRAIARMPTSPAEPGGVG